MSPHAVFAARDGPRDALLEIHARGHDAVQFGMRLLHMYEAFATQWGWTVKTVWPPPARAGATLLDAAMQVTGDAYEFLQYEHGMHQLRDTAASRKGKREQNITAQVIMLPGARPEEDLCTDHDVRLDLFRHSDNLERGIRSTDTVRRLTHVPTGVAVLCLGPYNNGETPSCLFALRAHLLAQRQGGVPLTQVEHLVRTYDLRADQIIDTRLRHTVPGATRVLAGELDLVIEALLNVSG